MPVFGSARLIGPKTGSVTAYINFSKGTNGLPGPTFIHDDNTLPKIAKYNIVDNILRKWLINSIPNINLSA